MKCLKEKCIHHDVCALYTFSGYGSDECGFYERQPHGEWIEKPWGVICSRCKSQALHSPNGNQLRSDFCPNCGAPMRKEGEHNEQTPD